MCDLITKNRMRRWYFGYFPVCVQLSSCVSSVFLPIWLSPASLAWATIQLAAQINKLTEWLGLAPLPFQPKGLSIQYAWVFFCFFFYQPATQWGQQIIVSGELQLTGRWQVNVVALGTTWSQLAHWSPPNTLPYSFLLLFKGSDVNSLVYLSMSMLFFERIFVHNFWIQKKSSNSGWYTWKNTPMHLSWPTIWFNLSSASFHETMHICFFLLLCALQSTVKIFYFHM